MTDTSINDELALRNATRGSTNEAIDAFAATAGGYKSVVERVLDRVAARTNLDNGSVGFSVEGVGDWTIRAVDGTASLTAGLTGTDTVMRLGGADFLRLMTLEVTAPGLREERRLAIEGDGRVAAALFSDTSPPIELATMVAATPERVWRAVTEEAMIWFAEYAETSERSFDFWGKHTFDTPSKADRGHPVLAWDPNRLLRFSWPLRGQDSTVEFSLTSVDLGTEVRVRHEGAPTRADGPALPNFWGLALGYLRVWTELGERPPMLDMSTDRQGGFRIECDIDAPANVVFETMHAQQAQQRQPGETWNIDVGVPIGLEMLTLDPDHEMKIGWTNDDRTSLVTWSLEGSGGRTRLTVVHSGMDPNHDAGGEMQGWYDAGVLVIKYLSERGHAWSWTNPLWDDAA